ncbi:hypothetical protein HDU84_004093 [Entophlyctis sp. JEL0112]|nr:hypothetical protein HDU84_004093 [Entophlyctis sp. JEL0112]
MVLAHPSSYVFCPAVRIGEGRGGGGSVYNMKKEKGFLSVTLVVSEIRGNLLEFQFLFELIYLVHEQEYGGLLEDGVVAYGLKQQQCLKNFGHGCSERATKARIQLTAVSGAVLGYRSVEAADRRDEQNRVDAFEVGGPLFPLGSLAADVAHPEHGLVDGERDFLDGLRLIPAEQHILHGRNVFRAENAVNVVEEAGGGGEGQ